MAKEIKFNIRLNVDGKEQLATATTSIREISDAVNTCRKNARGLNDLLIDLNQNVEAFRNAAETISQISSALGGYARSMAQTAQLTGLSGDELRELRGAAQAFATTFGADFCETMQAVNSLAKGFGITAQDAMHLVQDGMGSGANANGQFLDVLKEYPRYFKEAGISAEAFVAITTNAARQGVFSDKGVDAIKEANIRLREMLNPPVDASLGVVLFEVEGTQARQRDDQRDPQRAVPSRGTARLASRNAPFHTAKRHWPATRCLSAGCAQAFLWRHAALIPRFSCPPGAPQQQIPGRTKMQRKDKNGLPLA